MKPAPPIICATLLAAVIAASATHYWSVREFLAQYPTAAMGHMPHVLFKAPAPITPGPASNTPAAIVPPAAIQVAQTPAPPEDKNSKEFFEKLIQELGNLRSENRALTNQIAETNRDVMKMQFQIDTHSESFRPLPTSQERGDTSYGLDQDLPGVLPPRAEPIFPEDR